MNGSSVLLYAKYYSLLPSTTTTTSATSASASALKLDDLPPLSPHHSDKQQQQSSRNSSGSGRVDVSQLHPFFKLFAFAGFDPIKTMVRPGLGFRLLFQDTLWGQPLPPHMRIHKRDSSPHSLARCRVLVCWCVRRGA